jgi:hypothetical protein
MGEFEVTGSEVGTSTVVDEAFEVEDLEEVE